MRVHRWILAPAFVVCLTALLTSCGEGITGPGGNAGIRTIRGGDVTDTIDARPLQALVVEVRGEGGRVLRDAIVRFEAQRPADSTRLQEPAIHVCPLSAATCGSSGSWGWVDNQLTIDTTDAEGRAMVMLRFGRVAGRAVVRIIVPELGIADSAAFTVRPGAPARVVAPVDTLLVVGASFSPAARVVDRYSNPLPESPTATVAEGTAIQLAANGTVTARDFGVQAIIFSRGAAVDTMRVSVVPKARLAIWDAGVRTMRMINLDGTEMRSLFSVVGSSQGAFPSLDATRRRVTFHTAGSSGGGSADRIVVVDTTGALQRDIGSTAGFTAILRAREVADGRLLVVASDGTTNGVWNVDANGARTLVAELPELNFWYGGADISRDGARVAYTATDAGFTTGLRIRDLATGAETFVEEYGSGPSWSPDGSRLAYLDGADGLAVFTRDGGAKQFVPGRYSPGIAWSPDGRYLLARPEFDWNVSLWVIRIADAVAVPLRFGAAGSSASAYYQPDWR